MPLTDTDLAFTSTLPCRYGTVTFPRLDSVIGRSLRTYGEWAQAEVDLLRSLVAEGSTVVEVGANIGTHTLALCDRVGPAGRVFAVEPHPVLFALLERNVGQNQLANASLVNVALSDASGSLVLPGIDLAKEGNFGQVTAASDHTSGATPTIDVPVETIDSWGLGVCDLITADVEGMEPQVLRGAEDTLVRLSPFLYVECLTLENAWRTVRFLRDLGYDLWLHQAPAFNPANWYGSQEQIFGAARESSLLGIPSDRTPRLGDSLAANPLLTPVRSMDELARALLDTPRWGGKELEQASHAGLIARVARAHEDIDRLQRDAASLQHQAARLDAELLQTRAGERRSRLEAKELRQSLAAERQMLAAERQMLAAERQMLDSARRESSRWRAELAVAIASYESSTSWRVTAPLRLGKKVAGGLAQSLPPSRFLRKARAVSDAWGLFEFGANAPLGMRAVPSRLLRFLRYLSNPAPSTDPHWLLPVEYYLSRYPDVRESGINPLWHFVLHGSGSGRQTHPLFDTSYYLAQNPDVARSGQNALLHFLRHGAREGRDPSPWFASSFYRTQLTGEESALDCERLLRHYVRKGYKDGLNPHPSFSTERYVAMDHDWDGSDMDPLSHFIVAGAHIEDIPDAASERQPAEVQHSDRPASEIGASQHAAIQEAIEYWDRKRLDGKRVLLFVTHGHGGGTDQHVSELSRTVADEVHSLVMYPLGPIGPDMSASRVRIATTVEGQDDGVGFDIEPDSPELILALRAVGVERVHVHHRMGLDDVLDDFLATLALPYDVTLHDYYTLAPSPHLQAEDGSFIEPEESASAALTSGCSTKSLEAWREGSRSMLYGAERVIAPSEDTAARIKRYFPDLPIVAASHPSIREMAGEFEPPSLQDRAPMRVAIMGTLAAHKGKDLVYECADIAAVRQLPLEFHVIGLAPGGFESPERLPIVSHGPYAAEELPSILRRVGPHLAWFPSQVPETFSYTLSEAMSAGLPIVATAIGSFPERLGERTWTWLVSTDAQAEDWIGMMMEVRHAIETGTAPEPPPEVGTARPDYYPEEYLRPLVGEGPVLW